MDDTEWVRAPDPGRLVVPASHAAKLLRRDLKTIQKQIREGDLPGGKYPDKARWWVSADADPRLQDAAEPNGHPTSTVGRLDRPSKADREAELRRQLAARDAKLRDHEETIRQLTAAAALNAERADDAHKVNEHLLNAHEHLLKALTASQTESTRSLQMSAIYRDLLASNYIPDDPGELT